MTLIDPLDENFQSVQRLESAENTPIISPRMPENLTENELRLLEIKNQIIADNKFRGNTKELSQYKRQLPDLTQKQIEWGIGLLLSDASLQANNNGTAHRLKTQQSEEHLPFLIAIQEIFILFTNTITPPIMRRNSVMREIDTIQHSSFNVFLPFFQNPSYPSQKRQVLKKFINDEIYDFLTPTTIGVWFNGDGGRRDYGTNQGQAIQFSTHGFDKASQQKLVDMLRERYEWDARLKSDYINSSNQQMYLIQIEANSYESFVYYIQPHILPVFVSRLPSPRSPRSRFGSSFIPPTEE